MTLEQAVLRALTDHQPGVKDYETQEKVCRCGHRTPMHDMDARTAHLADVAAKAAREAR